MTEEPSYATESCKRPPPDLRIVPSETVFAHEEHDHQRALPLIEKLKVATIFTNPPIVTPMDRTNRFVILDGANRCYSFKYLAFPHLLVQVVDYHTVELSTWNHIISNWSADAFMDALHALPDVDIHPGQDKYAIAHIYNRDDEVFAVRAAVETVHERNAALRDVVKIYKENATLNRTALSEPDDVWPLYPDASALVFFPGYEPHDIVAAARHKAYLPPGISRHIVHGRALQLNYPMKTLREEQTSLRAKNTDLQHWLQEKLMNRAVRYYAEATYQFDE